MAQDLSRWAHDAPENEAKTLMLKNHHVLQGEIVNVVFLKMVNINPRSLKMSPRSPKLALRWPSDAPKLAFRWLKLAL